MEKKKMAKDAKKQISDVSKPGSTLPDSSSKPVIVSHKMIKDPMVSDKENADSVIESGEEGQKAPSEKPSTNKVIAPIETGEVKSEAANRDDSDEKEEEKSKSESDISEGAVVDAVVSQAADKNVKTREAEAEVKHREDINKLIESKKYFVKVKTSKGKRSKRAFSILILVALFGLVGVAVAADADMIPLKVPFDFIKTSTVETVQSEPTVTQTAKEEKIETNKVTDGNQNVQSIVDWASPEAKLFGIKFQTPSDWTFIDHQENKCTSGYFLEIIPSEKSIKEAEVIMKSGLGKVKIMLLKENSSDECGSISYYSGPSAEVVSLGKINGGWLDDKSLNILSSQKDILSEPRAYVSELATNELNYDIPDENETVKLGQSKVKIDITFDKGTYEQTIDPITTDVNTLKSTSLYKDIMTSLGTFQELR